MIFNALCDEHRDIFHSFLNEVSGLALALLDSEGKVLDCNQGFLRIMNLNEKPAGQNIYELLNAEEHAVDLALPVPGEHINTQVPGRAGEERALVFDVHLFGTGSGCIFFGEQHIMTGSEIVAQLTTLTDELTNTVRELNKKNTALERANATIREMMHTDELTGIANRRCFIENLKQAIAAARRHNEPLALVMCDLDWFKEVNDTYGHETGDKVLQSFAALLRDNSREEDLTARIGGEEFAILLPRTECENAASLIERLRRLAAELTVPETEQHITASFGVAGLTPSDRGPDDLLCRADDALYQAKNAGRNRVAHLNP